MARTDQRSNIEQGTMAITTMIGCANVCCYCPQNVLIKQYEHKNNNAAYKMMSFKDFKTCLEKIPRQVCINFSGMAEPWLNPYCTDMLLYAHEQGFKLLVYTTVVGMSLRDIAVIERIPFIRFAIHLPDANGKTNIPYDKEHIEKLQRLEQSKIEHIEFRVIGKIHPKIRATLASSIRELPVVSRAGNVELNKTIGLKLKKENFDPQKKILGRIRCSRVLGKALNHNILLPDGDVVLCCMDYGLKHIIGNLLMDSYSNLFRSSEYRRIQNGQIENSDILCRFCEAAEPDINHCIG